MKYSLRVSNVSISWRMFGWFSLKNIHKNSKQWNLKVFFIISEPVLNFHLKIEVNEQYLTLLTTWWHVLFKCKQKTPKLVSPLVLCLSPPVNHSSICPPTACVQFEDHGFILGCLADFPPILLEEFLAEKHFVPLSVFSQAQLTKFLPAKPT